MNLGFILSCHSRTDDLLAHMDIIDCYKFKSEIIPIYMRENCQDYFHEEMKKRNGIYRNGIRFEVGPLLALCTGIRRAKEMGIKWVIYRNGDDWLFNHHFIEETYNYMETDGKLFAAYNWLTVGGVVEFALNEVWLNVDKFYNYVDEMEDYFMKSNYEFVCEMKLTRWAHRALDGDFSLFHRLPDREQQPGVGYEPCHISSIFYQKNIPIPYNYMEMAEENNRFFNRKWQLIGSHDDGERRVYFSKIRNDIDYCEELVKRRHFARWLSRPDQWNLNIEGRSDKTAADLIKHMAKKNEGKRPKKMGMRLINPIG